MERLIGFRGALCATIAIVWVLSGRASPAEPLRLVAFPFPPFMDLSDDKAPGFSVEVVKQVFAAIGREASLEEFPLARGLAMIESGERDGIFGLVSTSERTQFCRFPDEPLSRERWVFFVRTADAARLKFSSFDDLVGHRFAVTSGSYLWPELRTFLREHPDNMVETSSPAMSLHMLAAGRVDYAQVNLVVGMGYIAALGLSGKIQPILTRSAGEAIYLVCFTKGRVDPAFVDAFSNALKQFKQTEAFQAIYYKYFP
jgi:polar amino acid transport system substrate-binding protein